MGRRCHPDELQVDGVNMFHLSSTKAYTCMILFLNANDTPPIPRTHAREWGNPLGETVHYMC